MRADDLLNRLDDQPFKPFRVHLSDGTKLDVPEPRMVIVSPSTAILPSQFILDEEGRRLAKRWRTVALQHIVQFSELEESLNGKRRRKK